MLRHALLLSFAALVVGCSSSSSNDQGATDVGPGDASSDADSTTLPSDAPFDSVNLDEHFPDSSAVDTGGDAGCASVTNIALEVTEQDVPSTLPTGGGGLIVDGTYTVTAVTKYTGTGGRSGPDTYRVTETMMITGGTAVAGVRKEGDALGYQYAAEIAPIVGGELKWKQTCPAAPGVTYQYDATPDSLVVYDTTQKVATTYTLKFHTPGP